MKAKLKLLEVGILAIVIILDAYLLNLNISTNEYKVETKTHSTANYINIEDKQVYTKEEIVVVPTEPVVYEGKTLNELIEQINKSLNSTISDKGELIVTYSLKKGVDPYLAVAIMLQETGCKWECSYIVKQCNNVGGQVGSGCGNYSAFNTLDEGIMAFIDNLHKNYISYGLTTPELINPKYASDQNWSVNVNKYIENIKAQ